MWPGHSENKRPSHYENKTQGQTPFSNSLPKSSSGITVTSPKPEDNFMMERGARVDITISLTLIWLQAIQKTNGQATKDHIKGHYENKQIGHCKKVINRKTFDKILRMWKKVN